MGVKSLTLLGLTVSGLFVYLCIESKKDTLYAKINKTTDTKIATQTQAISKPLPLETKKVEKVVIKKEPKFTYISTDGKNQIAAVFSSNEKDSEAMHLIDAMCGNDGCLKEIKYFDDVKEFKYTKDVLDLINQSVEEGIENFNFSLEKKSLTLAGTVDKKEDIDKMLELTKGFESEDYKIINNLTLKDSKMKAKQTESPKIAKKEAPVKVKEEAPKIIKEESPKIVKEDAPKIVNEVKEEEALVTKETIENQARVKKVKEEKSTNTETITKVKEKIITQEPVQRTINNDIEVPVEKKIETGTPINLQAKLEEPKTIKEVKTKKVEKIIQKKRSKVVKKEVKTIKKETKKKKKITSHKNIKRKVLNNRPKKIKDVRVNDEFFITKDVDPFEASYRITDILAIEPIIFENGEISNESKITLSKIATIIKELRRIRVSVIGYTSSAEDSTYAKVVSQKYADKVRNFLISKGVGAWMIKSFGRGFSDNLDDGLEYKIEIEIKEK